MKFRIALLCLTSCISLNAAQMAKVMQMPKPVMRGFEIEENNHEALCLLLEYGANPNMESGLVVDYTPLMWATNFHNWSFVKTLIAAGADKHYRNKDKKTMFDTLPFSTSTEADYELLKKAVADGEAERERYAAAKQTALEKVQDFVTAKEVAAIICAYAYGILPRDLPQAKKSWFASHCAIQ